jgi:thiol-disulfide isomerase/thioredoxin
MSVERLSKGALQKILSGKVKESATCVVKFYSTTCPMCKNLKPDFEDIAEQYKDLYFFAFNISDYPSIEKVLSFSGVPTISLIKTGRHGPKIRTLKDPENPHKDTWYTSGEISAFIDRES